MLEYLYFRLPLILVFIGAWIVYRLIVVTKLTDILVFYALKYSRDRFDRILLNIIITAAFLSFFIPNAVTVLILLPIIKTIAEDLKDQNITALTLSIIYGANIGGMGSLTGSPANLLLIGALDLYTVAGRNQISFFNWFLWALPLVVMFIFAAWGLIYIFAIPKHTEKIIIRSSFIVHHSLLPKQRAAIILSLSFFVFWIIEAVFIHLIPILKHFDTLICICFFTGFIFAVFFRTPGLKGASILKIKHLINDLPTRGILFLFLLIPIVVIVRILKIDEQAARLASLIIQPDISRFIIILILTLIVIFLTELFSNTIVSATFFPIAYFVSIDNGIAPIIPMIAVSLASTCAFMTPIATPCNALAFGEMKRTSLSRMLISGFFLNLIGAFIISLWLVFVIPMVYH